MLRTGTRSLFNNARRYSTVPPAAKPKSNAGLYAGLAGLAGLGAYVYLDRTGGFGTAGTSTGPKAAQTKSPLDPQNFVDFTLKRVEPYNHNTSKFVFDLPEGQASLLPVASCVVIKSSDPEALKDAKGKPVIRPYTPISPSDLEGELTFLIKKYDTGVASKYIHELKPGDTLAIKGPLPKIPYKVNEYDEVALIGGGSGITPLYQIITHALADKSNKTKFKLIFSNVTEKDILLRDEIEGWKKQFPDTFDYVFVLDDPPKGWAGEKGRVTAEILKKHVAPASLGEKVKVYICGPPPQVASVAGKKDGMKQGELGGVLKELGYSENQVFKF